MLRNNLKDKLDPILKDFSWYKKTTLYLELTLLVLSPYLGKTLCHYDLHPLNFLVTQKRGKMYIIDWETSFAGDPSFDLATVSISLNLNEQQESLLLREYYQHTIDLEEQLHFWLMKQHVYLYYSLQIIRAQMARCADYAIICMPNCARFAIGTLQATTGFVHPLQNSLENNYKYSILLSNTAFANIHNNKFKYSICMMLLLNFQRYNWQYNIQYNQKIMFFLKYYLNKLILRHSDRYNVVAHKLQELIMKNIFSKYELSPKIAPAFEFKVIDPFQFGNFITFNFI